MAEEKKSARPRKTTKPVSYTKKDEVEPEKSISSIHDEFKEFGGEFVDRKQKKSNPSFFKGVVLVVVVAVIAIALGMLVSNSNIKGFNSSDKYSAVFLSNGQVYIGTIEKTTRNDLVLGNVFYVQMVPQQIQGADGTTQTIQQPQLVKKGTEFYEPEDTIKINRDLIAVVETISEDASIIPDMEAQVTE